MRIKQKNLICRTKNKSNDVSYFVMHACCLLLQKFKKVYKIKVNFGSDEFKGY